jgi:hypothetical protein
LFPALTSKKLNDGSSSIALDLGRHDQWSERMPRKGVTGHDEWVVVEALATAYVALEQLPERHQPRAHMDDIRKLLASGREAAAVSLHLAQAKCRLFPERDTLQIYQEYGVSGDYGH